MTTALIKQLRDALQELVAALHGMDVNRSASAAMAAESIIAAADAAVSELAYAIGLAQGIHAKHFAEVTQWRPLPDLMGVLTQIDNMTSGLVQPQSPAPAPAQARERTPTDYAIEHAEYMAKDAEALLKALNDEDLLRMRREKAAEKLEKLDALLRSMQADAVRYLVPDNECGAEWFVSRMLWHLDGPEQREAQDGVTNG